LAVYLLVANGGNQMALTTSYLDERIPAVHTPESFSRALADHLLRAAYHKIEESGEADEVVIDDLTATVSPFQSASGIICVKICISTPFGKLCHHVGI
jgi:hypothetical protein